MQGSRFRKSTDAYRQGILEGDRIILSQAITLMESAHEEDQRAARELLESLIKHTGQSLRIGITGPPGVGKSTFIEAFGKHLTEQRIPIAVLTIDPSSNRSQGSILGDKTRMHDLSKDPLAYIRPSASGNVLGGVAQKTRESMLLCEAAGYKIILIETVGVGQSETAIKDMIDFFLLLALPGAGDELQGIKKGIMEAADAIVVTKADGDNVARATLALSEFKHALHLLSSSDTSWTPRALAASSVSGKGLDEIWLMIQEFERGSKLSGRFEETRKRQRVQWMNEYFQQLLAQDIEQANLVEQKLNHERAVMENRVTPFSAAKAILQHYHEEIRKRKS
ncbi:methylmalonyl Co-A mutase-associated GTPase MeaB [Pseudochryseolinea flava]|uniref:Methylmalonyl Co-A mutase-associated GTPase MeaB n=1 Tax=Pseudochryseolinea flava TaxID=2059302 RepID=A0A364XZI7_9BACT|nr:methylmalonyl Co-A mutase-associated GTPase MeaB [Pseudochryseolinea flava]RAV99794.1 methylmalonyl Co-A mutase-associated GTPase MeaB [Pseudochryseolinea flava]